MSQGELPMIIPVGISNNWLATKYIPAQQFNEAKLLHYQEEYSESNRLIESALSSDFSIISVGCISATEVISLYGWNLLFLKDEKIYTIHSPYK